MFSSNKLVLNVLLLITIVVLLFLVLYDHTWLPKQGSDNVELASTMSELGESYNVWCIFTKANSSYRLRQNLRKFAASLIINASIPLTLHVISDNTSQTIADAIFAGVVESTKKKFMWEFHNVVEMTESLQQMIETMQRHFSSQPGAYYGDALFFLSLGLHRVTPQNRAVMLDIDLEFRVDIRLLFEEFRNMPSTALVAAAPEQTPVYRHVLHMYRAKHRNTKFGEPRTSGGNPGVNSGVLLLNLEGQRNSRLYQKLLQPNRVNQLCERYDLHNHAHLGDQDWYTLVSQEHPELVHFLDCTWNRQLCLWWRHHGYHDIFDLFHHCSGPVKIYHGNCNTPVPV